MRRFSDGICRSAWSARLFLAATATALGTALAAATPGVAATAPPWSVIGTSPLGGEARQIAVAPDGSRVFVGNHTGDQIRVADGLTGVVNASLSLNLPATTEPSGLAISPNGDVLYVGSNVESGVIAVDPATGAVSHPTTLSLTARPWVLSLTPSGRQLYASGGGIGSNGFHSIDTSTWAVSDFGLPNGPQSASSNSSALTPDGAFLYVPACDPAVASCTAAGRAYVYRTSDNALVATVTGLGTRPSGIAANPAGGEVYVRNRTDNTISVISTATNTVTRTISGIGAAGTHSYVSVAVNPTGTYLVTANRSANTVSVIDLKTYTVERTIGVADGLPAANGAFSVAFNPAGTRLYVGNREGQSLTTLAVPAPPDPPVSPAAMAGTRSLTISYGVPEDNGSPITDYEYSLDGGATWKSAATTATTFTIMGLTDATRYSVKVRAVNAIGPGQPSAAIVATTTAAAAASNSQAAAEANPKITIPAAVVTTGATLTSTVNPSVGGTVRVSATLAGRTACTVTKTATKAGRMKVTCTLNARTRAIITKKAVTLKVTARLTDAKGKTATASRNVRVARYVVRVPVTG